MSQVREDELKGRGMKNALMKVSRWTVYAVSGNEKRKLIGFGNET